MNNRFSNKRKPSGKKNACISCILFLAVFLLFQMGVSSVSSKADEEGLRTLEQAVSRGIACYYATEGTYPENLDRLKERYGLTYNEDDYFIDYRPTGANLYPDVTIIRKTKSREVFP